MSGWVNAAGMHHQMQMRLHIDDPMLTELVEQYLYYSVEDGGDIFPPDQGGCRDCALGPLMGATLLYHVYGRLCAAKSCALVIVAPHKELHEFFNLGGLKLIPTRPTGKDRT